MVPVYQTVLVVDHRVGGSNTSELPGLDSGHNSNLTTNVMADLMNQGITVDDENEIEPENIQDQLLQKLNHLN